MKRLLTLIVASSAVGGIALAQEEDASPASEEVNATYARETHIDFREVHVEGVVDGPVIGRIDISQHKGFTPLIPLRENFDAEMSASLNAVK